MIPGEPGGREYVLPAITVGHRVYDADGDLVGTVESIDPLAGMMRVATNPFFEDPLVIPLHRVTNVDVKELFLSLKRRALRPC